MTIVDHLKYEKLLPHKTVDDAALLFLNLFKNVFTSESKPTLAELQDCITMIKSDYHQDSYHEVTLENLIRPKQLFLTNSKGQKVEYSYVSVKQLAIKYLKNESILNKILEERTQQNVHSPAVIKSAMDAKIGQRLRGKLKFEFYADDCETSKSSGLGSSHKILNVYMCCADLPLAERTHSDNIEKVISVDRNELKKLQCGDFDPIYELFRVLREDMYELMTQGLPVTYSTDSSETKSLYVTISHTCGDNLAIYELLGLSQCFNNNSFTCRFCGFTGKEKEGLDSIQNLDLIPRLIKEGTEPEALALIANAPRLFVFDSLPEINRWNLAPADELHDLFDGSLPEFVCQILTSIVKKSSDSNEKAYNLGTFQYQAASLIEKK